MYKYIVICLKAGKQIVAKDFVAKEIFQQQADAFWESLDGNKLYIINVPKIN